MEEFRKQGVRLPEKPAGSAWDSNIITPGTAFMHRLSVALQYYVHLRLNNDAGWRGVTVRPACACYRSAYSRHHLQLQHLIHAAAQHQAR